MLHKLEDISFFQEHRLSPKSFYQQTINGLNNKQCLNGKFRLSYATNPSSSLSIEQLFKIDLKTLDCINVPAHLELEGYGQPQYVNTQYPWDGIEDLKIGEVPKVFNPEASYIIEFDTSIKLYEQHFIELLGVESAFSIYLNNQYIGYSEDSFTTATFDITKALQPQANRLIIQVYKYSSGSWLEDQDFWRFFGIFRDVNIYSNPSSASADLYLNPSLSNNYQDGHLNIIIPFSNNTIKDIEIIFNQKVYHFTCDNLLECTLNLAQINLWSAEKPALYDLKIRIKAEDNLEEINERVGFVSYELKEGIYYVNNKRIIFNGVNAHDWNPYKGRVLSLEDMIEDLKIMKQHNINAIRTSHYPKHPLFYKLCNEYGFYVINEMNLETHGAWLSYGAALDKMPQEAKYYYPGDHKLVLPALLDRASNMYERDKNNACICMWSCGNESLGGVNLSLVAQYFKSVDQSRIVHYEGEVNDRSNPISDVESRMYDKIDNVVAYLKDHPSKPFIYCEYAHAMGNSLGNLDKYQALAYTYPHYQGGFIWEFKDHAIMIDKQFKYGGDFNDRPTDYNFVCDGLIQADHSLTAKIAHLKYVYQPVSIIIDHQIKLTNHYLFTNLNEFIIKIIYKNNHRIKHEVLEYIECLPTCSTTLILEEGYDEVIVQVLNTEETTFIKSNDIIAYQQKIFKSYLKKNNITFKQPLLVKGHYNVGLQSNDLSLLFHQYFGFNSLKYLNQEYLKQPLKVNVGRAFIDNDQGAMRHFTLANLLVMSTIQKTEVNEEAHKVKVRHYLNQEIYVDLLYGVDIDDNLIIEVDYQGFNNVIEFLDFGVVFCLDKSFQDVKYIGCGPYENYVDRNTSSIIDEYQFKVDEYHSDYLYPQEYGNHTNVSSISISNSNNTLIIEAIDQLLQFSALPHNLIQINDAKHQEELNQSNATYFRISLLHSGIGGDDSWGALAHDEYLIDNTKPINYSFKVRFK
ncbi:MAG: glycoside hydrolase family 2 TIM barrel-domain containing protein [Bacilli bacterium]